MLFGQDRNQFRSAYLQAWRKARAQQPLTPLERQLVEVITEHPEYHALLEDEETALSSGFNPDGSGTNPFLHMGLHVAIREQIATNRPQGIQKAYRDLNKWSATPHETEHGIMECLGQALWESQRCGRAPDETAYLECLSRLANGARQ